MDKAKKDLDVTRIIMSQRKMKAGLAALINGNQEKMTEAKKIFYYKTMIDSSETKKEI